MAFCRVVDGRVVEVLHVAELPPFTAEVTAMYQPCLDTVEEGWVETSPGIFEPWVDPNYLEDLRAYRKTQIKEYGLSLIQARIPSINSLDMIGFMEELWPMLDTTAASANLLYCKDVRAFALNRLSMVNTADQSTLESYDVTTDNWPT